MACSFKVIRVIISCLKSFLLFDQEAAINDAFVPGKMASGHSKLWKSLKFSYVLAKVDVFLRCERKGDEMFCRVVKRERVTLCSLVF